MSGVSVKSDNLTECGRVYCLFNKENNSLFTINCILCKADFSEWIKFQEHFQGEHQLEDIRIGSNTDIQKEKNNLRNAQQEDRCQQENHQLEDYFDIEYLDEELSCYNAGMETENESVERNLELTNKALESYNEDNLVTTVSTCFFRLCSTDKETMLKFIELLRQHPSQWQHKNSSFGIKEKRHESTLSLTKQLNEILNINVNPQGTRASILFLLRWFDREYLRYLNCKQNDFQFVCAHKEYFYKLLEFVPHQHLKAMVCDKCSKRFKSEHLLMAHNHKYHNGQVPFRCRYCGHGFIHQSSHKMHENRHIKINVWPCKICRYQATTKSDYIKHLATHSSHQPHKCIICGLAYKTKTNLNVHLKSHSLPNYECEFCKKKFYQKYRYKRHIWQHELLEKSCKSVDNFTCEICGRRLTSNKTLKKHQLVHIQENYKIEGNSSKIFKLTDVIVYFCSYCSLEFMYKEAYETHMNLKHDKTN